MKAVDINCPTCDSPNYAIGIRDGRIVWYCGECDRQETTDARVYSPDCRPANMPQETPQGTLFE